MHKDKTKEEQVNHQSNILNMLWRRQGVHGGSLKMLMLFCVRGWELTGHIQFTTFYYTACELRYSYIIFKWWGKSFFNIFCGIWELYEIQTFRVHKESFTGTEPQTPTGLQIVHLCLSLPTHLPIIYSQLEYNFPIGIQFSLSFSCLCIMSRALTAFFLDCFFKDICIMNRLRRYSVSLQSKRQVPIINVSDSLISGFLFCNITHCVSRYHLALFTSSCANWGSEPAQENADTRATAVSVSNKLSFVSDPGVLGLPPASMKVRQGRISHHSQFLTPPHHFTDEKSETQRREGTGLRSLYWWVAAPSQSLIFPWHPAQCSVLASGQHLRTPAGLWRTLGQSLSSLGPYLSRYIWRFDWLLQYYSPSLLAIDTRRLWFWKTRHRARFHTE